MHSVLGLRVLPRVCLANISDLNGSAKIIVAFKSLMSNAAPADLVVESIIVLLQLLILNLFRYSRCIDANIVSKFRIVILNPCFNDIYSRYCTNILQEPYHQSS